MTLPTDYAERSAYILAAVQSGSFSLTWVPLTLRAADKAGALRDLTIHVSADALKVDGVRFGAGARLAQQCADVLGALLVTPKILDLIMSAATQSGVVIPPFPLGTANMMETATMVHHSSLIDAAIEAAGGADGKIVATTGKPFCLSKTTSAAHGCNYGWNLPAGTHSPWKGIAIYPSVTYPGPLSSLVIQSPGTAHGLDQDDYASTACFVRSDCALDGAATTVGAVLQDPALAALLSHEGPLPFLRQPGVAQLPRSSDAVAAAGELPGRLTIAAAVIGAALGSVPGALAGAALGSMLDAGLRSFS